MLRSLAFFFFIPECPLEYYNLVAGSYQVGFECAEEHFVSTLEKELERKPGKSGVAERRGGVPTPQKDEEAMFRGMGQKEVRR